MHIKCSINDKSTDKWENSAGKFACGDFYSILRENWDLIWDYWVILWHGRVNVVVGKFFWLKIEIICDLKIEIICDLKI